MSTMFHTCRDCGHEYGKWHPRCPACGTTAPRCKHGMVEGLCAVCTGTVRATPQPKGKREKIRTDGCVLCRKRVKPNKRGTTCPHCNEKVHVTCLEYHREACLSFQFQRDGELKKLGIKA